MEITDIKIYLDKFYKNVYLVIAGNYIIARCESRIVLPINNNIYNEIKRKTYNYDDKIYRLSEYPKFIIDKYTGIVYTYIIFKMNIYDKSQIYNIVEGPITIMELYNEELKSSIYLLGDLHTKLNCGGDIQIQDFIEKTIQYNKDKVIDIFLEVGYSFKAVGVPKRFKMESYITDVENKFYNCMYDRTRSSDLKKYDKSNNCQYTNVRAHYADFRTIMPVNVDEIKLYYINILRSKLDNDKSKLLIQLIQSSETNNMFIKIYGIYNINNRITKQYDNIENKEIVRKIFDYYRSYYDDPEIQRDNLLIQLSKNNIDNEENNKINNLLLRLTAPILDLYILGRLFRKYRNINNSYSGPAKNSFIYLGRDHIYYISKLLEELGFNKIRQTGSTNYIRDYLKDTDMYTMMLMGDKQSQCLDISKFKQPFFSNNKSTNIDILRTSIKTIHINRQLLDIIKRIKPNDKTIIEVFNKINPTKLTRYDIDLFEDYYDSKLPSKQLENIHTNYILSLSQLDQEFFKLFVSGGHIDLNNFITNGFVLDIIPSNLDLYYQSFMLYSNQDIRLVNDPVKLQSYYLSFYESINRIIQVAPVSDKLITCYIGKSNQVDIYTDEFHNTDKFYFANLNTLDILNQDKTLMSISINNNFIYYYGYIILPYFLNLKCLRSNINREFLDINMNIITKNYISYKNIY